MFISVVIQLNSESLMVYLFTTEENHLTKEVGK